VDNLHLDQHISRHFNEELELIKTQMLAMGGKVEQQVGNAVTALLEANSDLARAVIAGEEEIDDFEIEIDEACTTLIARRQPTASDLRMVMSVSKIIRDLERIGDEAKKIAKMALELCEEGSSPHGYVEIRHIAKGVRSMLNDALDAFARFDVEVALATLKADEQIDLDYKSALRELVTYMMEDPRSISRVMNILWTLRSLERVGDHTKNICEHTVYLVRGQDIRHGNLDNLDK